MQQAQSKVFNFYFSAEYYWAFSTSRCCQGVYMKVNIQWSVIQKSHEAQIVKNAYQFSQAWKSFFHYMISQTVDDLWIKVNRLNITDWKKIKNRGKS